MIYQSGFIYILVEIGEFNTAIPIMNVNRNGTVRYSSIACAVEEKISLLDNKETEAGKLPFKIRLCCHGHKGICIEGNLRSESKTKETVDPDIVIRLLCAQIAESIPQAVEAFDKDAQ